MNKIKKDDKVLVLSGNYKGNKGIVLKVFPKKNRAIVSKINIVKKHKKPNAKNPKGGIIQEECSIHMSNLKLIIEQKHENQLNHEKLPT